MAPRRVRRDGSVPRGTKGYGVAISHDHGGACVVVGEGVGHLGPRRNLIITEGCPLDLLQDAGCPCHVLVDLIHVVLQSM